MQFWFLVSPCFWKTDNPFPKKNKRVLSRYEGNEDNAFSKSMTGRGCGGWGVGGREREKERERERDAGGREEVITQSHLH